MNESQLIRQLKKSNHLAFTILYEKYSNDAYQLSFKYLCNKQLAEDAVQNLFIKVWENREKIDVEKPLNHFIFTVLKNHLLNVLRDSKKNIFVLEDCLAFLNDLYISDDNDDFRNDQMALVKKAIDRLSPQRKKIFQLKLTGEYSNQEIADQMGLSINTIKFQYSQSIKQIRVLVREFALSILV